MLSFHGSVLLSIKVVFPSVFPSSLPCYLPSLSPSKSMKMQIFSFPKLNSALLSGLPSQNKKMKPRLTFYNYSAPNRTHSHSSKGKTWQTPLALRSPLPEVPFQLHFHVPGVVILRFAICLAPAMCQKKNNLIFPGVLWARSQCLLFYR